MKLNSCVRLHGPVSRQELSVHAARARVAGPRCVRCGGPGNTGDGIYAGGEWLCGGCIAGMLRDQTISDLFRERLRRRTTRCTGAEQKQDG